MKTEVQIDVTIPKGYKIKRIGAPREGELYISEVNGELRTAATDYTPRCWYFVIVEKVEYWREATPEEIVEKLIYPAMFNMGYENEVGDLRPIQSIESLTRQYVYVLDTTDYIQQVCWSDMRIREIPI